MKASGTLRTVPGGLGTSGLTVEIRRHSDNALLGTATTDAAGRWTYQQNGAPGPWYWTATDATADPPVTRKGSSLSYGSGGVYSLVELPAALRVQGPGVIRGYLNELAVTYDGSGLDLAVASGAVLSGQGIPGVWYTPVTVAIATAQTSNPRQCWLVMGTVGPGEPEEGKITLYERCGSAAASPVLPSLSFTEALWEEPLATFRLPATGSTTLTQVDQLARRYSGDRNIVLHNVVRRTDPMVLASTSNTGASGEDAVGLTTTLTLAPNVTYDLEGRVWLVTAMNDGTKQGGVAVYLNGVGNLSPFVTQFNLSPLGLSNAFALPSVVGTGAPVACGARVRVTGGSMSYTIGYFYCSARPRS
jgi:hypothetical protein